MGRARRQNVLDTLQSVKSSAHPNWHMISSRIPARSPLAGGRTSSTFTKQHIPSDTVRSPSLLPQGPPHEEDGEENPEAALLVDIALGQIGKDAQGNRFQLLQASEDKPPSKILVRCLENEEVFWMDCSTHPTVEADTVSYGELRGEDLQAWVQKETLGRSVGDALLRLRWEGLWDMQVKESNKALTQIGQWIITEYPGGKAPYIQEHTSLRVAAARMTMAAENIETYPAIRAFADMMEALRLPATIDSTDLLRQSVKRALLGNRPLLAASADCKEAASRTKDTKLSNELFLLSEELRYLQGSLPRIEDEDFLRLVAPIWRKVSRLRLQD